MVGLKQLVRSLKNKDSWIYPAVIVVALALAVLLVFFVLSRREMSRFDAVSDGSHIDAVISALGPPLVRTSQTDVLPDGFPYENCEPPGDGTVLVYRSRVTPTLVYLYFDSDSRLYGLRESVSVIPTGPFHSLRKMIYHRGQEDSSIRHT